MAAACKSSPAGNRPEPLLHFPKWLRERLKLKLTQDLGKEAAQFVLKDCSFAFIGRISDIPRRLWKKLKPVKYFNNQVIVCENAISSMAKVLKKASPRYKSLSVKSVETELLQVALYYGELELKIKQRKLSFDKLKEEILKVYGETRVRCPEFRAFMQGVSRQYGYNLRKDTKLLRKLIVHFITEVVLFGNLPKVILDSSGRSNMEEGISRDIVQACIKFIEETKLISGGEIKTLKELAKKGGASQREKKKMLLSIFDFMPRKKVEEKIRRALKEDKQRKDKTSQHIIPRKQQATFVIEAQQKGVLAGLEIAMLVFKMVNPRLEVKPLLLDGDELRKGKPILIVRGNARSVMGAERVALNYLQQLSGIATMTAKFVKPTAGTNVKILDTRKTTPGMRAFQKYAVRVGGGKNHRMDLEEMDLIKDTHLDLIRQELGKGEGIITEAVKRARAEDKNIFIEVEVQSVKEAKEALENGVDRIMLDNMPCSEMKKVVKFVRRSEYYKLHGKPTIEASGNVNLRTVGPIAGTGVDYISVGLITRSAPSLDIHLKVKPVAEEVDINMLVNALTKAMRAARIAAGIQGPKIKSSSAGRESIPDDLSELIHFYTEVTRYMYNADLRKENTMEMMVALNEMNLLIEDIEKIDVAALLSQREDLTQDILKTLQYWKETIIPNLTELHTKSQLSVKASGQATLIAASLYRIFYNYLVDVLCYDFRRFLFGNDLLISLATEGEGIVSQDQPLEIALRESYVSIAKLATDVHEQLNELMVKFGFSPEVMDIWNTVVRGNIPEGEIIIPIGDTGAVMLQEIAAYEDILNFWKKEVFPKCHEWLSSEKGTKNDTIIICTISMFFDDTAEHIDWYTKESLKADVSPENSDFHIALLRLDELLKEIKTAHTEFINSIKGPPISIAKALLSTYSMPITHTGFIRDSQQSRPATQINTKVIKQIDAAA